ncbi:MAG: hypothetical protein ACPGWR_11025 [Ardenticatenaceae bacterium]
MSTDNVVSGRPRVLVIENDPRWQRHHEINLTRWGYRPFLAEGQGAALLEDATNKAKTCRCHVALVDMRLLDHYDTDDSSGLHLVPKLKPTRSIIVTAYSTDELAQKALTEKGADHFISKRKGPDRLKKALDLSLQKICAAKKGLQIEWADDLSAEMIISSLFAKAPDHAIPADEVNDLLHLLFPNAKRLKLQHSDRSMNAHDQNVVMLNVYVDESHQPQVVKIGKLEEMKDETQAYQDDQIKKMNTKDCTPLGNVVDLWNIRARICHE